MTQDLYDYEKSGATPTTSEAEILSNAQGEIITNGNTSIVCPRCGKYLRYNWYYNLEITRCFDINCIVLRTKGI